MPFDYAIARFSTKFPAALGSFQLQYDLNPEVVEYESFGYPQADPFDGLWDNTCISDLCGRDWWMNNPQPVGISCDSTGGCSGGPWIKDRKYIVGVNSYLYYFQANRMWSPYFDNVTSSFYDQYSNVAY